MNSHTNYVSCGTMSTNWHTWRRLPPTWRKTHRSTSTFSFILEKSKDTGLTTKACIERIAMYTNCVYFAIVAGAIGKPSRSDSLRRRRTSRVRERIERRRALKEAKRPPTRRQRRQRDNWNEPQKGRTSKAKTSMKKAAAAAAAYLTRRLWTTTPTSTAATKTKKTSATMTASLWTWRTRRRQGVLSQGTTQRISTRRQRRRRRCRR